MKRILALCIVFMMVGSLAWGGVVIKGAKVGVETYGDITFYHNCDALGNATKSKGSAVITYDVGILSETSTPILGAGSWDNNNDGEDDCYFSLNGNLNTRSGRIGFYFKPIEISNGAMCWTRTDTLGFKVSYNDATKVTIAYRGGSGILTHPMSAGGTYYIEFMFTSVGVTMFIDGIRIGTVSGTANARETDFHFFSSDAFAWDSNIDQVICSSDQNRNLYAVKDITKFN